MLAHGRTGFGLLRFRTSDEAQRVIEEMHGAVVKERKILVGHPARTEWRRSKRSTISNQQPLYSPHHHLTTTGPAGPRAPGDDGQGATYVSRIDVAYRSPSLTTDPLRPTPTPKTPPTTTYSAGGDVGHGDGGQHPLAHGRRRAGVPLRDGGAAHLLPDTAARRHAAEQGLGVRARFVCLLSSCAII